MRVIPFEPVLKAVLPSRLRWYAEARFLGPLLKRHAALTGVKNLRVAAGLS